LLSISPYNEIKVNFLSSTLALAIEKEPLNRVKRPPLYVKYEGLFFSDKVKS